MILSVTTGLDNCCSMEVSDDLELENFKALCEAEVNIPASTMCVFVNGNKLEDDKKSLRQLSVVDGDLVLVLKNTPSQSTSTSNVPSEVAQFDFSKILVPSSNRSNKPQPASGQATQPGPSNRQTNRPSNRQTNTDVQQLSGLNPLHTSSSDDSIEQRQTSNEGENKEDPAVILDMLKSNPEQLARLGHSNPALAEAANKGLEDFTNVLKEQQQAKIDKDRQRMRMLTSDPFDAEAQKLIASTIHKENIDANMEAAMEYNPESFGIVQMLYINCSVNGHPVKAFIDSGAQTTIMSEDCAKRCHIMRLVDQRWSGVAKGVGTQRIIGRVHMVQLQIGGVYLASSFSILQEQPMDMLLGLDMLKRHQMVIDLLKNVLQIGTSNTSTPFLSESELPECCRLTSGTELKAEEKAMKESEDQAKQSENQAIARAVEESAKSPVEKMDITPAGSSSTPATTEIQISDGDIAEIMAMGFSQEEAVSELRKQNNDKTIAIAALFAKKFAY